MALLGGRSKGGSQPPPAGSLPPLIPIPVDLSLFLSITLHNGPHLSHLHEIQEGTLLTMCTVVGWYQGCCQE